MLIQELQFGYFTGPTEQTTNMIQTVKYDSICVTSMPYFCLLFSNVFCSMWVEVVVSMWVVVEVGNGAGSGGGSAGCREVLHASSLQYPSPVFGSTLVGVEVGWLWSIWVEVEVGW